MKKTMLFMTIGIVLLSVAIFVAYKYIDALASDGAPVSRLIVGI